MRELDHFPAYTKEIVDWPESCRCFLVRAGFQGQEGSRADTGKGEDPGRAPSLISLDPASEQEPAHAPDWEAQETLPKLSK